MRPPRPAVPSTLADPNPERGRVDPRRRAHSFSAGSGPRRRKWRGCASSHARARSAVATHSFGLRRAERRIAFARGPHAAASQQLRALGSRARTTALDESQPSPGAQPGPAQLSDSSSSSTLARRCCWSSAATVGSRLSETPARPQKQRRLPTGSTCLTIAHRPTDAIDPRRSGPRTISLSPTQDGSLMAGLEGEPARHLLLLRGAVQRRCRRRAGTPRAGPGSPPARRRAGPDRGRGVGGGSAPRCAVGPAAPSGGRSWPMAPVVALGLGGEIDRGQLPGFRRPVLDLTSDLLQPRGAELVLAPHSSFALAS